MKLNPNIVCSPRIDIKQGLEDITEIFIDAYKQVCRFGNVDLCAKVIRHVEYSEAEKKLSFNHAGLSDKNFKQVVAAL